MSNIPRPPSAPKSPGNGTNDLLNDLGEEMAHVNRQLRAALESLRMMEGFMVLTFFLAAVNPASTRFGLLGALVSLIFAGLMYGVLKWYATKRIP